VDRPADRVLRLALSDQGILTIVLGKPRPDDVVVDCAGRAMIHVESAISDMVDRAVLDKVYTPDGPTLSIRPASS
jgi:hypothetical protein